MGKTMTMKEYQEKEDMIVNRILINFGVGALGYIFLWVLWKANLASLPVLISATVFFVVGVACFIVAKVKNKAYMPYGIMFCAFALAALFIKSSYVVSKIIGMERFMALMQDSSVAMTIFNAKNDVRAVAACGGIYLVVMLIVNIVLLVRLRQYRTKIV